jgi:hypothetical protein
MFAIQIHSLEPLSGDDDLQSDLDVNNIFLDVSSEGQRPRYAPQSQKYSVSCHSKAEKSPFLLETDRNPLP